MKHRLNIGGRVLASSTTALPSLRVEAWIHRPTGGVRLAWSRVDTKGRFEIALARASVGTDGRIYFQVADASSTLMSTEGSVEWRAGDPPRDVLLVLPSSQPGGSDGGQLSVQGVVLQANGGPMTDVVVRAFDKTLRHEKALGETRTDAKGSYRIVYDASLLAHKDGLPDLVVRSLDAAGKVLGESAVLFRAPAQAQVHVVIGGTTYVGYSQYEQISQAVDPALDGATLGALTAADVAFLASDTGLDASQVQAYADANRLAPTLSTSPDVVYALLNKGQTADATALATAAPDAIRDALRQAVAANVVPPSVGTRVDAAVAALGKAAVSTALAPAAAGHVNVGTILGVSGVAPALLQSALQVFADPNVSPAQAWAAIRTQAGAANAAAVDKIQLTLQLGLLTHNHAPLVAYLVGLTGPQHVSSLQDLAKLTRSDWYAMLSQSQGGQPIGVPVDVPGASDTERRWNYATTLARAVEEAFPSAVLAARLASAPSSPANTDVVHFLGQNPNFDLVTTSIAAYLKANPSSTGGVADVARLTKSMGAWQRLARVTPRVDEVLALSAAGLTSAQSIARMGWGGFVATYGGTLGTERADIVFGNASHVANATFALYSRFNPHFNFPWVGALNWLDPRVLGPIFTAQGLPDYATLFGSLDYCLCDDCRSITSPAAYLVDLFQFMGGQGSAPQNVLRSRRPDLFATKLSCANTNTPMPYLDLVNEVLENAVAPPSSPITWPQTPDNATADELAAQPVSVNQAAYDKLATATLPWTLPFDLGLEEARIYLAHLGVALPDLAETFGAPPATVAAARLDLTAIDLSVLTSTAASGAAPPTEVDTYLTHSGLSYDDLLDVLWTDFVNPQQQLSVTFTANDCSLSSATLTGMSPTVDATISRFTRLRRKLGWTAFQLDAALRAFRKTAIDEPLLETLSAALALAASTGVDVVEMMSWWALHLDTKAHRDKTVSFYDSVFQNKTVLDLDPSKPGGDYGKFTVDATGKLNPPPGTSPGNWGNQDHLATFSATLGLSVADVLLIAQGVSGLVPASAHWPSDIQLTDPLSNGDGSHLGNISHSFQVASLARGLGLSIHDFEVLHALTAINPFASPADTRNFVAARDAILASPFSIEETGEILLGIPSAPGSALLTTDAATVLVQGIRTSYAALVAQYAPVPDTTGDRLRKALAAALPQALTSDLDSVVAIASGTSPLAASDQLAKLHAVLDGLLGASTVAAIGAALAAAPPSPVSDRFDAVLFPLLVILLTAQSRNMIVQQVATATKSDVAAMRVLLTQAIRSTGSGSFAMDDLLAAAAATDPTNALAIAQPTLTLVAKAALVVSRFRLTIDELGYTLPKATTPMFVGSDAVIGWLNLNTLPGTTTTPFTLPSAPAYLNSWLAETATFAFRDRFAVPGAGALDLVAVAATNPGTFPSKLSSLTGWSMADIQALVVGPPGIGISDAELASGAALAVLTRCADALARLGASAQQAIQWVAAPSSSASAIKSAAKSKYQTPADWFAVAKPLRDALRVQQRDALVAWLIGSNPVDFPDADHLFDQYLIDVEMGSCAQTSRIKQAIGSTQIFIQRILMNLEPGLSFLQSQATQWTWMGRYRVRQANLEVLLYPENWLDPTLRDDMTPFFQDLMNDLGRSSPTSATAEVAYRNYLEKVEDVARLFVVATYQDQDTNIVHVLARTPGQRPKYYYRSYQSTPYAYWTAWMAVPLDITDDAILLVVWNRHLHVIWGVFTRPSDPPTPSLTYPVTSNNVSSLIQRKMLEVRLAWSELRDGAWSTKRVTTASFDITADNGDAQAKAAFHLTTSLAPNDVGGQDLYVGLGEVTPRPGMYNAFMFPGCGGEPIVSSFWQYLPTAPRGLHYVGQWMEMTSSSLFLDTAQALAVPVLLQTPPGGTVVLQRDADSLIVQSPFFYQDERRCFFVQTSFLSRPIRYHLDGLHPALLGQVATSVPYVVASDSPVVRNAVAVTAGPERFVFPPTAGATTSTTLANVYTAPRSTLSGQLGGSGRAPYTAPGSSGSVVFDRWAAPYGETAFLFEPFYHPYVCDALGRLNRFGLDGLLSWRFQEQERPAPPGPELQRLSNDYFTSTYAPGPSVQTPPPKDDFDVRPEGAFSVYNWEMFHHAPRLIAQKLTANYRFDEANAWLEYIFDPTDTNPQFGTPARYWKFIKFFNDASTGGVPASVVDLVALLSGDPTSPAAQSFHAQVAANEQDPFNPFVIARLRVAAFEKATVIAYIDNRLAWGDYLFSQNTLESINEAHLHYTLVSEMLRRRPVQVEPPSVPQDSQSYDDLVSIGGLGDLSDPLVPLENAIPGSLTNYAPTSSGAPPSVLYFCVPGNDEFLTRWDTVADRLFKIRHCMNIQGQVEQLPLFEPPINPALLIRAAAAGMDLSSVLSDLATPLPFYRFQTMVQKASELAGEVRALGQALLGALEKSDAEYLALLRSNQEVAVQNSMLAAKKTAVTEAQSTIGALTKSMQIAQARYNYYSGLQAVGYLPTENNQLSELGQSSLNQGDVKLYQLAAAAAALLPTILVGVAGAGGTPEAADNYGGSNLVSAAQAAAGASSATAAQLSTNASSDAATASYTRRDTEWRFQATMATMDMDQITSQVEAANARYAIATDDLATLELQIQNGQDVSDFLRSKFTSQQLYDSMVRQISSTYFTAYQLAYDLAKRAERTFHREIGDEASPSAIAYIQFGYWDSLQQGLLAGERLAVDLRRMETAYLEQNRRELEITKHVSLLEFDPVALTQLKGSGTCFVYLPESLFDADFPGHYMRRIKSVAVTVPCEVGPYTSVNCTLTLVRHGTRWSSDATGYQAADFSAKSSADTLHVAYSSAALESIVTSTGQGDGGLFEVNLRDERYLPFEGAGVISLWKIDLPPDTNAFDTTSITDLILHLRYTARDGGDALRQALKPAHTPPLSAPKTPTIRPPTRLFLASQDFSDAFYRFMNPDPSQVGQYFDLDLSDARFPFHDPGVTLNLTQVRVFLVPAATGPSSAGGLAATLLPPLPPNTPLPSPPPMAPLPAGAFGSPTSDLPSNLLQASFTTPGPPGHWTLMFAENQLGTFGTTVGAHLRLNPAAIAEIGILCTYG